MDTRVGILLILSILFRVNAWYVIYVKTSDSPSAGTRNNVDIKLYGDLNEQGSSWVRLENASENDFETGRTGSFIIQDITLPRVGTIFQMDIQVRHDNGHVTDDWHLDWVSIMDYGAGGSVQQYQFGCKCWIGGRDNPVKTLLRRVNGGWTENGSYSACSQTCGNGTQTRSRSCTNPKPYNNGSMCVGSPLQTRGCFVQHCPVNGEWSEWTGWGHCSVSCGEGTQRRTRTCDNPRPAHGGQNCVGNAASTRTCHVRPCPVDGGWSLWTDWGSCSTSCGDGVQTRSRSCDEPAPTGSGRACSGNNTLTRLCNVQICPVDGGWTVWEEWSSCSASCDGGVRERRRTCSDPPPAHGGSYCSGEYSTQELCNNHSCQGNTVNGGWSKWTQWSKCSATCGGEQRRARSCNNPSFEFGGLDCRGEAIDLRKCRPCEKGTLARRGFLSDTPSIIGVSSAAACVILVVLIAAIVVAIKRRNRRRILRVNARFRADDLETSPHNPTIDDIIPEDSIHHTVTHPPPSNLSVHIEHAR